LHVAGTPVKWHDHGQVEADLASVIGDQAPCRSVHLARIEFGHQGNALLLKQPGQSFRRHRLGEGAVERSDVRQFHPIANADPLEEPVGQKTEFQGGNRALDGHIDHVDHQPASVESLECIMERRRSPTS